jgi:hypothetical protein
VNPREPQNSGKGTTDEPKVPQGGLNSALYACALTGWMGVFNVRYIYIYTNTNIYQQFLQSWHIYSKLFHSVPWLRARDFRDFVEM